MNRHRVSAIVEPARSIERPSVPLSSDEAWLYDAFGAVASSAGERVTYKSALTLDAVWRAVSLISSGVAKLPIHVYQRTGDNKEKLPRHPAYRLLERRPNEYMTPFTLKETLQAHALLQGNGYAAIVRERGVPVELLPLDPEQTYPVRERGVLAYVTYAGSEPIRLAAADVLHVKGLGYDGLQGYSVVSYATEAVGLGLGTRKYGAKFFGNGARPGVVLEFPGTVRPEVRDELRKSWERIHQGLDNSHRVAVLTHGGKVNPFTINAKDSQLLESRAFTIREIANFFGLPPHKLGDNTRAGYNSLEQENQSYLDDCLDPWLVKWEEECFAKLLSEPEKAGDSIAVEFNRAALVRANMAERYTAYQSAILTGWMSVDEVRAKENMNPVPEGKGAAYFRPLNVTTTDEPEPDDAGDANDPGEPADNNGDAQRAATLDALRVPLLDAAGRMVRRVASHVRKAAREPKQFLDALPQLAADNRQTVIEAFTSALSPAAALGAAAWTPAKAADALLDGLRQDAEAVYSTFTPAEFAAALETRLAKYETEWPAGLAVSAISWRRDT